MPLATWPLQDGGAEMSHSIWEMNGIDPGLFTKSNECRLEVKNGNQSKFSFFFPHEFAAPISVLYEQAMISEVPSSSQEVFSKQTEEYWKMMRMR